MMQMKAPALLVVFLLALVPQAAAGGTSQVAKTQNKACQATDNSPGFGGQEVECPFFCDKNNFIKVSVTATDEDADASGTAMCSDVTVSCGDGSHTCSQTSEDWTSTPGEGMCSGSSAEFVDSGLSISCSATPRPQPVPTCIHATGARLHGSSLRA